MAAAAIKRAEAGSGNSIARIDIFAEGQKVIEVRIWTDKYEAAAAGDVTDINAHVSATIQALDYNTLTTITD